MFKIPVTLKEYASRRDALLARMVRDLQADRRIAAAWLEGSFGRGEADQVSDLDLHLAVEDGYSDGLCFHATRRNAGAFPERLALISTFGRPAVVHENHNNAPAGVSFSFVLYAGSAVMVDWVLAPRSIAVRPAELLLLFEKTGIPIGTNELPQVVEGPLDNLPERVAFFWMMAAVCCKFIARREDETVEWFFKVLQETLEEVGRLIRAGYGRMKTSRPVTQAEILLRLCNQMDSLTEEARRAGFEVGPAPLAEVKTLLNLSSQP